MPGALSYDKLAYFTLALRWAQRLRDAAYPESAAALFVEANRGQAFAPSKLTALLDQKGVPRCNAQCQLAEVRPAARRCTQLKCASLFQKRRLMDLPWLQLKELLLWFGLLGEKCLCLG